MSYRVVDDYYRQEHFDYDPGLESFLRRADIVAQHAREKATLAETAEGNTILFTAIPGVRFTGLTHVTPADRSDGRARVAFGRFFEDSGRLMAPVGLGVNHIFIDGAALGRLVESEGPAEGTNRFGSSSPEPSRLGSLLPRLADDLRQLSFFVSDRVIDFPQLGFGLGDTVQGA